MSIKNYLKGSAVLHVVARPKEGFRRAGYKFLAEKPTIIKVDDLTKDQLELLANEPNLVIAPGGASEASADDGEELKQLKSDLKTANAKVAAQAAELKEAKAPAAKAPKSDAESGKKSGDSSKK